jgi:hypothetical protein
LRPPDSNIETVHFLQVVNLTQEQIAAQFSADTFDFNSSVKLVRSFSSATGSTCAALSAFHAGQDYLGSQDYVMPTDANTNYLLLFAHGVVPGQGTKTMTFLAPTTGSTVNEVDALEGKLLLQFAAALNKPKVNIPAAGPWVIERNQLTVVDLQAQAADYDRIPTGHEAGNGGHGEGASCTPPPRPPSPPQRRT